MFLWFAVGSALIVWMVFQSPMVDYRLVMAGSVLPVAGVAWGAGPFDSLLVPVLVLALVMSVTSLRAIPRRRTIRRRLLGVPIGMFLYLVLNGSWAEPSVFWWPARGIHFPDVSNPIVSRGVWSIILEALGGLGGVWLWGRWGLDDPDRRRRFLRTGHLDRVVAARGPGRDASGGTERGGEDGDVP